MISFLCLCVVLAYAFRLYQRHDVGRALFWVVFGYVLSEQIEYLAWVWKGGL